MARLLTAVGPPAVGGAPPFTALIRAIVSQQVSVAAARSILGRVEAAVPLVPERLARVRPTTLQRCGVSKAKSHYLITVAKFARAGQLDGLAQLDDEALMRHLTGVKGVGVWTAQMVMIFAVGRPDIWPVGDVGIQRAARMLYRIRSSSGLERLGQRFRPYRSYAAGYLWRSLE